jgi:ATP-dependent Zn protease
MILVKGTTEFPGVDLINLANVAALKVAKDSAKFVVMDHIERQGQYHDGQRAQIDDDT